MIACRQEIDNFTYSNIVETVALWSSTTGYLLGALVRVGFKHYKSLHGTATLYNTGNNPLTTDGTAWIEWEPSNLYSCLDAYESTLTTWAGNGIVRFLRGAKNNIIIGNFNAKQILIKYLDVANVVIDTQTYNFYNNTLVFDEWDLIYADFVSVSDGVKRFALLLKGVSIQVEFYNAGASNYCGILMAGKGIDFGRTVGDVSYPETYIGTKRIRSATFSTAIPSNQIMIKLQEANKIEDETTCFIINDVDSSYNAESNIIGKFKTPTGTATNFDLNILSFKIDQNILT